jgi:C1A family cysteine protease
MSCGSVQYDAEQYSTRHISIPTLNYRVTETTVTPLEATPKTPRLYQFGQESNLMSDVKLEDRLTAKSHNFNTLKLLVGRSEKATPVGNRICKQED